MSPVVRGYRFNWRGFITPAVKVLVLTCAGVFLLQTVLLVFSPPMYSWFNHFFGLVPSGVFPGLRIWQPFTYMFLHGGVMHILINMFMLWMFGRDLELDWGKRKFYTYFFVTGVGAGIINILVNSIPAMMGRPPSDVPTIGASGAIFGILIANAVLYPDRQIWLLPFPVSIPMRPYVAVMAVLEFYLTWGSAGDNVSHLCHLGGMLVGYIYLRRGSFLYRTRNVFSDWQRRRLRKKFEVYVRDHQDKPPSSPDNWVN